MDQKLKAHLQRLDETNLLYAPQIETSEIKLNE